MYVCICLIRKKKTKSDKMASHSQVLVEEKLNVKILTLNNPKQLNALTFNMISRLLQLSLEYEEDPSVKLVILKGQGRAFCAPPLVRNMLHGNWRYGANFSSRQYTLNYVLATYSKPQVSIVNGIVMGGGAGVSIHGRFRIVTENTVFAMPETALGLFPDVGASYFLSRLPGFFGEYVGLTGTRLDGAEMLACGLATQVTFLISCAELSDANFISTIIDAYTEHPHLKHNSAYHRLDVIDKCFSKGTVEEIISALEREVNKKADDWISATILSLKKASPTSLKISLRSMREGRLQGVGHCLIREYRILCHVLKGDLSKDFAEWEQRRLKDVKDRMVDHYFERIEEEGWDDLKYPPRNNLHDSSIPAKL